jgi:hypothetical protein
LPGRELYNKIFDSGLLNSELNSKVHTALEQLTTNTRYQGRVRVNLPPRAKLYNIVIFKYTPALPRYATNQCFSFPREEVTFCDSRFLDAFPDPAPIQVNKNDESAQSILFLWALGHELGHVVLRHSKPGILNLQLPLWERLTGVQQVVSLKSLRTLIAQGSAQENEADEFAIHQLRLNQTASVQMALALTDAALWFEDQYRNESKRTQELPTLYVSINAHPPMLMRILSLSATLQKLFVNYEQLGFIDDENLSFRVLIGNSQRIEAPTLIFDGFYHHIQGVTISRNELVDLLLYDFFRYGTLEYKELMREFCGLDLQHQVSSFCGAANNNEKVFDEGCAGTHDKEIKLECLRYETVIRTSCLDLSVANKACSKAASLDQLKKELESTDGIQFTDPNTRWLALAHANIYIRGEVESNNEGGVNIGQYVDYVSKKWGPDITLGVIEQFIKEYSTVGHNTSMLVDLHSIAQDLAKSIGDIDTAIIHAEAVNAAILPSESVEVEAARAGAKTVLARLFLPTWARSPPWSLKEVDALVGRATPLFDQSLSIREKIYDRARADNVAERVSDTGGQLIIALNDVVYSLDLIGRCDSALKYSKRIEEVMAGLKIDEKSRATSLENVSTANSCSISGDSDVSFETAKDAVKIRSKYDQSQRDSERKGISLFTLWAAAVKKGDQAECRQAAQLFVENYKSRTTQNPPDEIGGRVNGRFVAMRDCLN